MIIEPVHLSHYSD